MGDRTGAQVTKHGSGEHDRVTGFNNVIKSDPLSSHTWLADKAAGQHESYYYTWVFYYSHLSATDAKHESTWMLDNGQSTH